MAKTKTYPNLRTLIGGYFHQDAYEDHETEAEILAEFVATQSRDNVAATAEDIDRFLAEHRDHPARSFAEIFRPDIGIGDTDNEARDWLQNVSQTLRQSEPS